MQLLLIRHAESANNELAARLDHPEYMHTRTPDPQLTRRGFAQARALTGYLTDDRAVGVPIGGAGRFGIAEIYVSPMLRALQTARPFVQALDVKARTWIDLHEQGGLFHGDPEADDAVVNYPGLTLADFARDHPEFETIDTITEAGWWQGGYEDLASCRGRAARVATELHDRARHAEHTGQAPTVALVSHGIFLDSLLKALFGHGDTDTRQYYFLNNAAITHVDLTGTGRLDLRFHNRTEHLPPELISE